MARLIRRGFSRKPGREARVSVPACFHDSGAGGEIRVNGNFRVSRLPGEIGYGFSLSGATFEKDKRGNLYGLGEKAADQVQAICAPVEGKCGIMTHLRLGRCDFLGSEIREVGGDQRGGFREILQKVVLFPFHPGSFRGN
jgi:hypothetical protein